MSILTVTDLSCSFGGRKILEGASFRLLNGEHVGLVGANGEGKSTFLKIITGQLAPDAGKVEWAGRVSAGYLDQHSTLEKGQTIRDVLRGAFSEMFQMEEEMLALYDKMGSCGEEELPALLEEVGEIQTVLEHSGFYTIDARIEEFANGLGLGEIGLERDVDELSGGQRSKVLLTKLLLKNPSILILDEPTNYLDENHIRWLAEFLRNYENAFILVSHDISFLNQTVNLIYHVENAVLTRYVGNYDEFIELYKLKKRQNEQAYEKQQKEIESLEKFIAKNKARAATATLARSCQKKLDKMELIDKTREKAKPVFAFRSARTPGRVIFETKDLVLGYDSALTRPLNISLERGQKIAIKGVNGLGKSTLLKTLLGIIPPFSGEVTRDEYLYVGYFEQEESASDRTALDEIWNEYPSMTNGEVRAALAKCALTNEHITSQMRVLSGGENAKVRLCRLMLKDINFLVLDEPTNHLDPDAKEELARAIKEFKGTVLLVCHESEFYSGVVTDVWNVEDWTTKVV